MNDLISWLRAQLDADERALLRRQEGHPHCLNFEGQSPADYTPYDSCYLHVQEAEATPYRDVEFGLRQVRAHRAILNRHGFETDERDGTPPFHYCLTCGSGEPHEYPTRWPCATLLDLVSIYSDRDGYRAEWS